MELELTGRVALITGPAKGMGAAVTLAFAREGCRLALLGRDIAAIEPVATKARALGSEVIVMPCDVTVPEQCNAAAAAGSSAFSGCLDILVNVAGGTGPVGKLGLETTAAEFEQVISLNTIGCFNMIRAVLPTMIERRFGKIINVGGTFGMRGRVGRLAYSASKWALRGVTKSFALEVGCHNINVNCVAPGMVDGPRFREKVSADLARRLGISREEAAQRLADEYALKRISTAEDVANACLFLGSVVSRQVTGIDLPVDGGWATL